MSTLFIVTAGDSYYPNNGVDDWKAVYTDFDSAMVHSRFKPLPTYSDDDDVPDLWDWFIIIELNTVTKQYTEYVSEWLYNKFVPPGTYVRLRMQSLNGKTAVPLEKE